MKQKWTVARGPRVWQIAMFLGVPSRYVLRDLNEGYLVTPLRSIAQRVPLKAALDYTQPRWAIDHEWDAYCERMDALVALFPDPHASDCRCMTCAGVEYEVYPFPEA